MYRRPVKANSLFPSGGGGRVPFRTVGTKQKIINADIIILCQFGQQLVRQRLCAGLQIAVFALSDPNRICHILLSKVLIFPEITNTVSDKHTSLRAENMEM